MTNRLPLVVNNGQVQQIQAGDVLDPAAAPPDPQTRLANLLLAQQILIQRNSFGGAGFVPYETPTFLIGG